MIREKLEKIHTEITEETNGWSEEKAKMRERIFAFMDAHPIPASKLQYGRSRKSPFEWSLFTKLRLAGSVLVITLTLGGSVSYAAQDALPGDSLYRVKTNINEEILSWITISPRREANLQVELAAERIKETEKLAAKGKIETKTALKLKENFKKHASKVEEKIDELKSDNKHEEALEVSSKFESSLKAHESVLADLTDEEEAAIETSDLIETVEAQIDVTSENRSETEKKIKEEATVNKDEAQAKMKLGKEKITEVANFIESLEELGLDEKVKKEAEARIKRAQRAYDTGRTRYLRGTYSDALINFEKTVREALGLQIYLEVTVDLDAREKEAGNEVTPSETQASATSTTATATTTDSVIDDGEEHETGTTTGSVVTNALDDIKDQISPKADIE